MRCNDNKDGLRPVEVNYKGDTKKGFFHRFVYMMHGGYSETKALVELDNGMLRYYDPYFVQFTDRKTDRKKINSDLIETENQESTNDEKESSNKF